MLSHSVAHSDGDKLVYPRARGALLKKPMVSFCAPGKQEADTEGIKPLTARRKVKARVEVGRMVDGRSGCLLDGGLAC